MLLTMLCTAWAGSMTAAPDGKTYTFEVTPPTGWKLAEDADQGMVVSVGVKGGRVLHLFERSLAARLPASVPEQGMKPREAWVRSHFSACEEARGVCRPFYFKGYARLRKEAVSVALTEGTAPEDYLEFVHAEPYERKIDPAFEREDTAYYGALDAGTATAFEAWREAHRGRPVLVVFSFEGCGPCLELAREVLFGESDALEGVDWMLVDMFADDASTLRQTYGLDRAPTFVALPADGEELARTSGYGGDTDRLQKLLRKLR